MELPMRTIQVQVASPEIHKATRPGPAAVLTESTRKWASRSGSDHNAASSARAVVAKRGALGQFRSWTLALAAFLLTAASAHAQAIFSTPQPVGATSGQQNVTVTAQAAGAVASVQVLTAGAANLDFAPGTGLSNCGSATLAVGATCTESVTFTPVAPGLRIGAVVLLDSNSKVLGTAYLSGTGSGGLGVLVPGNVVGVAGAGRLFSGPLGDGGPATSASMKGPSSVTVDGYGNMYIADSGHSRIRMVTAKTGIISTFAGNGNYGLTGDQGPAISATLNTPSGVALDGAGNLYIADTGNNVIRKVTAATGIITTVVGNGAPGSSANVGDGGPAISANLNSPQGLTVDAKGNLFIADTSNHRIRRVDAVSGIITTVAGNGTINPVTGAGGYSGDGGPATSAELNFPFTVAFDPAGNMYIPDSTNNRIRMVSPSGAITTFAGTGVSDYSGDGGAASSATLFSPEGVIADPAGNVYIADTQNAAIRKVSSATGLISTLAVNDSGEVFWNGSFYTISIYGPIGLFLDGSGNLYLVDYYNQGVQQIQSNFVALDFTAVAIRQGEKSAPKLQTVENDGNAPFDVTAINLGLNVALDPATTTCVLSPPLMAVNQDCEIGAEFAPSTTLVINPPPQQEVTDYIDVGKLGDTVNSPLNIQVTGIATVVNATTTTLQSSLNPSGFGQSVSFTAAVTTGVGTGNLTGTVTFYVDGVQVPTTPVCPNPVIVNQAAVAVCATTSLSVGVHKITASYNNDLTHFPSTSPTLSQTVLEGTTTALASSQNPSSVGQSVTFTATVAVPPGGGNVPPDGTVTFWDGSSTILGSATIGSGGVATLAISTLADGVHAITATYNGDSSNQIQGSTSAAVSQDVLEPGSVAVTSSPNPSNYGNPVLFVVSIASTGSVAATGKVNILDGGSQIGTSTLGAGGQTTFTTSSLAVGSHTVTVAYAGDLNYGPATSLADTQVVNQAVTATSLVALPNPAFAGGAVTITATVKVTQGAGTPTGTVTFTSGTVTLGSAALGAAGTATIGPSFAVGADSVVATYSGDTNDSASASAPLALTVQIATTSTIVLASPSPAIVDSPVTFTAKVIGNGGMPSGPVTFSADGASMGTVTLDATGTATLSYSTLAAGTHSIAASYAGDANDSPSTSAAISLLVGTIPTGTALGASSSSGTPSQVSLVATVVGSSGPTPTGTVTFNSGTTQIGAATLNSSGVATLNPNLATGAYTIVAVYSGDLLHTPSTSLPVSVSGTPSSFNIAVNPPAITMAASQNATVTVTFTSIAGFTDSLGLGCASLPAAVTCHFSSPSVTLAADGIQTAQLTIDTNNPLSGGSSAMNSHPGNRGAYLAGLFLPISVFFGLILWRFRKRHGPVFTVMLVLLLSGAAMLVNGCSGFSQASASPGTYVIQVTATGADSDVIHYQNVTLNITQ
jgi:sugar lactone lactonase YvrE